jgi:hypothetical protein
VRRAPAVVLLASGLKLLNVPTPLAGIVLLATIVVAPVLWMLLRRYYGFAPSGGLARARHVALE